jgi:subfamily B ATP-binding cassette protein HlyB/CyaB
MIDPAWLRRQVGVVLQENFLFNRSVRDNIALADPSIPMERIVHAAEIAGAHDFILGLSNGYDTLIEERGSSLSGGQRQRVAIARSLAVGTGQLYSTKDLLECDPDAFIPNLADPVQVLKVLQEL